VALLSAAPLLAQLPDTPTGRRGNAILEVLRSGPGAITIAFFTDNFDPSWLAGATVEERREELATTLGELGELTLQGVRKSPGFGAVILAASGATGRQVEISYTLEDEEPHRIVSFEIEQRGEAIAPISLAELPAAVEAHVAALAARDEFSGAVLVARGEEILFEAAYGLADRRYGAPNRLDTAFNLGSINKIFTRVALARLARDGRLSFADTIADHLPDYPNAEVARRVTLQHLAAHTSGLGDIFTEEFAAADKSRFREPEDYFPLFAADDLLFEPGEGRSYSNAGYMVLGAVIASVTGETYDEYVRETIFEPAGMTATAPWALDDPTAPIAIGYTRGPHDGSDAEHPGTWRENSFIIPHTGTPAGGGFSAVRDLLAFRHALAGNRLIDPRYTAWLVNDELPEEAPASGSGLGIGVAGGAPGVNAALEMEGEWTVVVLANLDPPAASDVAARLRVMLGAIADGD
jgi:CubicO group peptidase (beta-lactamase class C family)